MGAIAAGGLLLFGCSTTESRISENRELYNGLSPRDQQLVAQSQIRPGMSQSAVWMSWGSPDQKAIGNIRGNATETWLYLNYSYYPYSSYPYGPYGGFYGGFGGGIIRGHHGNRFAVFGDPFYDPFYSYIPLRETHPYKTVTFANGRVMSFQYLVPPYRY